MSGDNDPDHLVVHRKEMGPGYRFLVRSVVYVVSALFFAFAGMTWVKLEQSQGTTEVLKIDSIVEAEVRQRDEELLTKGKALIRKLGRVYDDNGNPHPDWVQHLKYQRAIARARSNNATVGERATYVLAQVKRVWE